ncbi:Hypothetical predicted protein [Lecanosticta acicola]|uniref:Glycosyl transferase CAP10 domain-containing protein n=1 Tax=Lecanosticta acicola TaxID=111012 RepID=A0AAI8Z027_9PEZI|nr:Hypothetical predicted protein [Lecanosticta acicola]
MHPVFWKALCAVLLLCVLVQQFGSQSKTLLRDHVFESSHDPSYTPSEAYEPKEFNHHNETGLETPHSDGWSYNWERDRDNHGLSAEQCDIAFPELYYEIDRAVHQWQDKKITPSMLDVHSINDGTVRVLLVDQQIRILQTRGMKRNDFRARITSVLHQVFRAITAVEGVDQPMPDMEFTVIVDDHVVFAAEPQPFWGFTRKFSQPRHDNIWIMPDFHFWAAPPEADAFRIQQSKCRQHDAPLERKIPKVVWRGVEWTNPEVRKPLIEATQGQQWADVVAMHWDKGDAIMPMDAFCKFRYMVNTEGRAWSARMTHLLNCDSLLFVHDVEWIAHYYHLLDTGSNCVRVERDFSDLGEKVLYFNDHTEEAQAVADAQRKTFRERYTTPAASACYWRKMMRAWAAASFEPTTKVVMKQKDKLQSAERLRGISLEEFLNHDNTRDYGDDEKLNMLHHNEQEWVEKGKEHEDKHP